MAERISLKVHVEAERCQGHNRCYSIQRPSCLKIDELGNSLTPRGDGTVSAALEEKVTRLMRSKNCPEHAVRLEPGEEVMTERRPVVGLGDRFRSHRSAWIENPFPIWDDLRKRCPIAYSERFEDGAHFPSRYADVRGDLLRHRALFLAAGDRARE